MLSICILVDSGPGWFAKTVGLEGSVTLCFLRPIQKMIAANKRTTDTNAPPATVPTMAATGVEEESEVNGEGEVSEVDGEREVSEVDVEREVSDSEVDGVEEVSEVDVEGEVSQVDGVEEVSEVDVEGAKRKKRGGEIRRGIPRSISRT